MSLAEYLLPDAWPTDPEGPALSAYLLGQIGFDEVLHLQRRLHFDITGDRAQAALVLCEHPPLITVGRQGSSRHIHIDSRELHWRNWPVRWVQRGGGCWLHLPGQLAVYFLLPLDRAGLRIPEFQAKLCDVICHVIGDFSVRGAALPDGSGVMASSRLVAGLGVAVRDWVTTFGACLNIHPDLDAYHMVRSYPLASEPMTSLQRERRGPVRPPLVRQRLLEHLATSFRFSRVSIFTDHPALQSSGRRLSPAPARTH